MDMEKQALIACFLLWLGVVIVNSLEEKYGFWVHIGVHVLSFLLIYLGILEILRIVAGLGGLGP